MRIALIIAACCSLLSMHARGASGSDPLKPYLDAMQRLSQNCQLHYDVQYVYPDRHEDRISGNMFLKGTNYVDSSNVRFVFRNQEWLVVAEHPDRMLNVIYLPDWRKAMGEDLDLDINGFLIPDGQNGQPQRFSVKRIGRDTLLGTLGYQQPDGEQLRLELWYANGSNIPCRYRGELRFPKAAPADPAGLAIRFECTNISTVTNQGIFDSRRLIKVSGERNARMIRYSNYRIRKRAA